MFFGGDQFKNHISNNLIIKCHECGDTNLRYVDPTRTGTVGSGYVCGNGHETWGAIDDWTINGQTDTQLSQVKDCCCEGVECNLPHTIYVNFEGIEGVQVRESCTHLIGDELSSRVWSPIQPPCGPCCNYSIPYDNGPWNASCGCETLSGACTTSTDGVSVPGDLSTSRVYSREVSNNGITKIDEYAQYTLTTQIPAGKDEFGFSVRDGVWKHLLPALPINCPSCSITYNPGSITPGFFEAEYPQGYRDRTPALINVLNTSLGPEWTNGGESIFFYIKQLVRTESTNNGSEWVCQCASVKLVINVILRIHPSVNPTDATPQFDFSEPTNEGIAESELTGTCAGCSYTEPGYDPGWNGPDSDIAYPISSDFCNLSNQQLSCVNCNAAIGDITATNCNNNQAAKFWPYRMPQYESAQFSPTTYQFFQRDKQDMQNFPSAGECFGCSDCGNKDRPDYCYETIEYRPCLEVGTNKCFEEDAKYRIPCSEPTDNFTISYSTNTDDSPLQYRYSVEGIEDYKGFWDLEDVKVTFNPIFNQNFTSQSNNLYDYWSYPPHPNSTCRQVACPGFIPFKGDPGGSWTPMWTDNSSPSRPYHPADNGTLPYCATGDSYGAYGVSRSNLAVLLGDARFKIEQPHCARRVKNADLSSVPFYMVNTDDVSNQTIVLDRYYPTGGSYDYMWKDRKLAEDGNSNQAYIKNRGDIGITDGSRFPYPFIANSGSTEEPELIAIIHSASGTGGQIAFQTFPVSYDSDVLVEPYYFNQTDYVRPGSICPYKTRVTVHGYGVMYPLRDDPIWSTTKSSLPEQYDPNNPQNLSSPIFEYPVLIPGVGYDIGDKIEFRCWKTLEDSEDRQDNNGDPIASGINESIWREECVETIVATATITELNDERLPPKSVVQSIPGGVIKVSVIPSGVERYYETYQLGSVNLVHNGTGYNINDTINIEFNDSDAMDGIHYDEQPSIIVTSTGLNGKIEDIQIAESGSFYKIIRTGGIRWYEFDETDNDDNLLISVGNCPCSYDVCSNKDCTGCVSKNMYPSSHNKTNSSPFDPYENIVAKQVRTYFGEPWYKPFDENTGDDAEGCATNDAIKEAITYGSTTTDQLIPLYCPEDGNSLRDCQESCDGKVPCDNNCGCNSNGDCECTRQLAGEFNLNYIGGWNNRPDFYKCWPLNNTWEFDGYETNYGLSACSGDPVDAGFRPYADGYTIIPPKRPQYKYVWKPNTQAFLAGFEDKLYTDPLMRPDEKDRLIKTIKSEFLSIEGCNPLRLDRFGKSYKFLDPTGEAAYGANPCRKINDGDPVPSGVTRTLDNYCRVYGFYQQIQPSCEIEYRGQYIMRAAQKFGINGETSCSQFIYPSAYRWTDCEPIIGNITINLKQIESKFDISVGAPYNQDHILPEQLPEPYLGPDGKYEVTADPWDEPSLTGVNNTRLFDQGFYEPNRYGQYEEKILPENTEEAGLQGYLATTSTYVINPVFTMPNVDGKDFTADQNGDPKDRFKTDFWDLPDPRSNCRPGIEGIDCTDECLNPDYAESIGLPISGIRNDLRSECPYPWEMWGNNQDDNGIDYFCMFKNNSAEIVLDKIVECDDCISSDIITSNYLIQTNDPSYPYLFWYSYAEKVGVIPGEGSMPGTEIYLLFKLFGDFGGLTDRSVSNSFKNILEDYKTKFNNRYDENLDLYTLLSNDIHRTIFFNMVFSGSSTGLLDGLTRVEIFLAQAVANPYDPNDPNDPNNPESGLTDANISRLFVEYRCGFNQKGGSIKSLKVQNGGDNYAFEIEERVSPSGIIQNINDASLEVITIPKELKRRRETYCVSGVLIDHTGTGYAIDQLIPIQFNDTDFRRGKIFINDQPEIKITEVDEEGKIVDWVVTNSGDFYKYVGTDEHRAYPIAMVLNNYWDHGDGSQNFGRHAKLRPVVGVDKSDPDTYGKIKRVEVDFGGIDYVMPGKHWKIETTMGEYDEYSNLQRGLDVQHLVDPCKFDILSKEGLNTNETQAFKNWGNGSLDALDASLLIDTPTRSAYYDSETGEGDPFQTSVKHYVRTQPNGSPVLWEDKVQSWSTILSSGSCPIDGSGNLLDRVYNMALVEEGYLWNNSPVPGNCNSAECNNYIDDVNCDWDGQPNNPYIPQCGSPCPVFTVYDAHRFNIGHTDVVGASTPFYDVAAGPPPYLDGCSRTIEYRPDRYFSFKLYCYGRDQRGYGGELTGKGFREYKHLNSPSDRCSSADYSYFVELGLSYNEKTTNTPHLRTKSITYGMGQPIKMKISYDKDTVPVYSGICPTGIDMQLDAIQSGLIEICDCAPVPTPTP